MSIHLCLCFHASHPAKARAKRAYVSRCSARSRAFVANVGLWILALAVVPSCRTAGPAAALPASSAAPIADANAALGQTATGASADTLPFVDAPSLLREAEALWAVRTDEASLEAATQRFERALVQQPADGALAARLARAYFLLGYGHLRPRHATAAMKQAFERGMLAAEAALGATSPPFRAVMDAGGAIEDALAAVDAPGLDALTWYIANLGGFAAAKGSTVALFYGERLRVGLRQLLALDAGYFYATPHRFMAMFLAKMPGFAGGSMRAARYHFEQARKLSPLYFDNALAYAQFYATAAHDRRLRQMLLEEIDRGDAGVPAEVAAEQALTQAQARMLLQQKSQGGGA